MKICTTLLSQDVNILSRFFRLFCTISIQNLLAHHVHHHINAFFSHAFNWANIASISLSSGLSVAVLVPTLFFGADGASETLKKKDVKAYNIQHN